jgi:hypothetical protein
VEKQPEEVKNFVLIAVSHSTSNVLNAAMDGVLCSNTNFAHPVATT